MLDLEFQDIHGPNEAGDEFIGGLLIDFARSADLFEDAAREDDDAIGDLQRLLLVVGDEEGGDVEVVVERDEPFAQLLADLGVHGAEGLIEQEHTRFGGQGAGDGGALALAAGELVGVAALQALQAEEAEQLRHARPNVGPFPFLDLQPEGDVVGRCSCS